MPFPWKKARTNRLSQIVADLQSPKRGGSLVVETGFPTSLVDLFVKHRDRLKKPSTRKKSKKKKSKLEIHNNSPISQQSSPCSIVDSCENPIIILEEAEVIGDCGSELVPDSSEINVVGVKNKNMNENRLFVILSKVFVVAILASSTKKLVIGITLSAFTLLLLEFVVGFLKPCSNCNHLGIDKILVSEHEHEHEEEEEDEEVSEREGNLGSMILVLIVLAGLFGGRFMAVIITIGGCFLFKLIENLKVRSFKMPFDKVNGI